MLKRMLCLLFVFLWLPILPVMAEESGEDILTLDELRMWVSEYKIRALATQPLNDPTAEDSVTEDGYLFVYDFATLYMDRPEMTADSLVQALVIYSSEEEDMRGLRVDDSAETVLAAYYTENPDLVGSSEQALLYAVDVMPEGGYVGMLHRNGQRIEVIDYAVYEQPPTGGDGYSSAGILYTMTNGNVTAIRAYGLTERIQTEDVAIALEQARRIGAEATYSRVETSLIGTDLERFNSEDLIFAGMKFPALTPEDAAAAFGEPLDDMWLEDSYGYMRVMRFSSCDIVFLYDMARQIGRVKTMTIHNDQLEGPRSVRLGDTVASVINRFRNGEGETNGMTEILYGATESGEFGMMEYGTDASVVVRYGTLSDDGVPVLLYLSFDNFYLNEIILMVNE